MALVFSNITNISDIYTQNTQKRSFMETAFFYISRRKL